MTFYLLPRMADARRAALRIGLVAVAGLSIATIAGSDRGMSAVTLIGGERTPTVQTIPATPTTVVSLDTVVIGGINVSTADGYIREGEEPSPFDESVPAIANLDPGLRDAVQQAATDANADGIALVINSGWRSTTYQQALLDEAIVTYGSEEEARKLVQTPEGSNHVSGEAVDIGPTDADYWLIEHGAEYGLCQTYANEVWHFELMTEPGGMCPEPIDDAAG
jgi:hypothetical protein